jgi:glucose/arabinose dehydrogenase
LLAISGQPASIKDTEVLYIAIIQSVSRKKLVALSIATAVALAGAVSALFLTDAGGTLAQKQDPSMPVMQDKALRVELVTQGLQFPTSMHFLDDGSLLVLQKNDGQVWLVSGGKVSDQPARKVNVANDQERGLLGVATRNGSGSEEVFLYFTENSTDDGIRNRVYKYNYDASHKALVNSTLVLDLQGEPGPFHNGGKIAIGPDGYLYAVIGDISESWSLLDNEVNGTMQGERSAIVRVDRETGEAPKDNPFYGIPGFEKIYAYGIRNSFGLAFDPVTKVLWMTENGPDKYDEINVVTPGFNGGWDKFSGPIARSNATASNLVLPKGAHYSDPAFSWFLPIGATDIAFLDSGALGEKYRDNVFVGDINNGNLYFFKVNGERNGLQLDAPGLSDRVADLINDTSSNIRTEADPLVIGTGFGRITDIETGPDGYLYVLTYEDGKVYRITGG